MELKFTVDTEDILGNEYGSNFDELLTDSLKKSILDDAKGRIKSDKFADFVESASKMIEGQVKLKFTEFLNEDIALSDRWGKPTFVGSIEDLFKLKIDDILLRAVNNQGEKIEGCSTSGAKTWIEWKIEDIMKDRINYFIEHEGRKLSNQIKRVVEDKMKETTDEMIKSQVSKSFSALLSK